MLLSMQDILTDAMYAMYATWATNHFLIELRPSLPEEIYAW